MSIEIDSQAFSLRSKFNRLDDAKNPVAEFNNRAEYNNFRVALDLKGARFTAREFKKTKRRSAVWTVTLESSLAVLD